MGCSGWFRRRPQQRAARALYAPTRAMGQSARPAATVLEPAADDEGDMMLTSPPRAPGHAGPADAGLQEPELLRRMVEIIVREADPQAIVLFGSRARGDARADSHVDVLVIEREPFGPARSRIKEAARLYRALGDLPASKDLLVYSRDEVEARRSTPNHIVARAFREGLVVYGDA
jgi:uncharacterized protein